MTRPAVLLASPRERAPDDLAPVPSTGCLGFQQLVLHRRWGAGVDPSPKRMQTYGGGAAGGHARVLPDPRGLVRASIDAGPLRLLALNGRDLETAGFYYSPGTS